MTISFASLSELRAFLGRVPVKRTPLSWPGRPRRGHPEADLQRAVCDFWRAAYPDTWLKTFHSPNGLAAKNPKLAAIFVGLGVKAGVFDLLCIARRGEFNGFALELKADRGRLSASQREWLEYFEREGWSVAVARDLDVALELVRAYHRLPSVPARVEHGKAERGATT